MEYKSEYLLIKENIENIYIKKGHESSLSELFKILSDYINKKEYLNIDNFISNDHIRSLDIIYLIGIVNFLFFEREKISYFTSFFNFVKNKAFKENKAEYERLNIKFSHYGF